MVKRSGTLILTWIIALLPFAAPSHASSDFTAGRFAEAVRDGVSYSDFGICQLFTGPRGPLAAGQFLLTLGDHHSPDYDQLQITGTYRTETSGISGPRTFVLSPDDSAAVAFFENVLREELSDPRLQLRVYSLTAAFDEVRQPGNVDKFGCDVNLTGRAEGQVIGSQPVNFDFGGAAQLIDSVPTAPSTASVSAVDDKCPLASLAPAGLDPRPNGHSMCNTPNCILNFKGYQWWTSFEYFGPPFPQKSYYWNEYNQWSPKNALVDGQGNLHLFIRNQDTGGGLKPSAADVTLMFKADGSEANLGFGDYLVTAQVLTAASWDNLNVNATFGAFTYERWNTSRDGTGTPANPDRELDLAEITRWGGEPFCRIIEPRICPGNAQLTLQRWDQDRANNINRYTISSSAKTVTLVMRWHGANQPVTFLEFDGSYTFATLPPDANANYQWTTPDSQNRFVPATNCERFHLNLWMGNYGFDNGNKDKAFNPPPTLPQEVVVSNFEFKPFP